MPLIRRMPKRGFNNARHAIRYHTVNVGSLNDFQEGSKLSEAEFRKAGLVSGRLTRVKILGDGDLAKKLTVVAHSFSASAKTKIEAKGGKCELVAP